MKAKIKKVSCRDCGESWILRVSRPKKCPNCQSKKWDRPNVYRPALGPAYKTKKKG